MELWHRTDQAGRDGIAAEGFRVLDDGPPPSSPDHAKVWFASTQATAKQHSHRTGWWVRVEAPDDTPEHDLGPDLAGHGIYRLAIDEANNLPREFLPES